jgi:hypothetical protein
MEARPESLPYRVALFWVPLRAYSQRLDLPISSNIHVYYNKVYTSQKCFMRYYGSCLTEKTIEH